MGFEKCCTASTIFVSCISLAKDGALFSANKQYSGLNEQTALSPHPSFLAISDGRIACNVM
jgi:hypothetical protein